MDIYIKYRIYLFYAKIATIYYIRMLHHSVEIVVPWCNNEIVNSWYILNNWIETKTSIKKWADTIKQYQKLKWYNETVSKVLQYFQKKKNIQNICYLDILLLPYFVSDTRQNYIQKMCNVGWDKFIQVLIS